MHRIYIALGSNLEKPSKQIHSAIRSIDRIKGISVTHISSLYKTKPIGKLDQPDFINAVIELKGDGLSFLFADFLFADFLFTDFLIFSGLKFFKFFLILIAFFFDSGPVPNGEYNIYQFFFIHSKFI